MRIVAKFQFVSLAGVESSLDAIAQVLDRWGANKFTQDPSGATVIRTSGRPALFDRRDEQIGEARQIGFDVLEPVPGGDLQTRAALLQTESLIHFQCTLGLGSDGGLLTPQVEIRSPRFVREIVDGRDWRVRNEGERIFAKCFDVDRDQIETLVSLMTARERRLPLVVVSELLGRTIGGDIHERIIADVCGLAHTCRLTSAASWALTEKLGKEWSCYNGAVRLFWPFRLSRNHFRAHPLWTYDFIMRGADNEAFARDRLRSEIAEILIEASTFVADDPCFRDFETEKSRRAADARRASASESGDYKVLAEAYAKENDALRQALEEKTRENNVLQQNVEALTMSVRAAEVAQAEQATDEAPPPLVVADALDVARKELKGRVAFSEDTEAYVSTLNPSAGPPDKILRYLRTLGRLADALEHGLGKSVPIWLRQEGVDCSVESETVKKSREAQRERTFRFDGQEVYCQYHAKPSDGVSPDLCARIYFATRGDVPRVLVGYIGRHFD